MGFIQYSDQIVIWTDKAQKLVFISLSLIRIKLYDTFQISLVLQWVVLNDSQRLYMKIQIPVFAFSWELEKKKLSGDPLSFYCI